MAIIESKHKRINAITGEVDYYFPMEVLYPEMKVWAKNKGLDVVKTRLGFREFEAVMIPCKKVCRDEHGEEVYVATSSEEQRTRYLAFIKDEMNLQEKMKVEGRCNIPNGRGGLMRCPRRIPNPNYTPDNGEPKTLPVKCKNCKFESFKRAYSTVPMSLFDPVNEDGDEVSTIEPVATHARDQGAKYEHLMVEFEKYVRERKPKLGDLAHYVVLGYKLTECCELLGASYSTVYSRMEKLKQMVPEFLENLVD